MDYVVLPGTDLQVSRIALGCEPLGGVDWGRVDAVSARRAVHRAVDLGINFFDTADIYGLGHSEEVLGEALGPRAREVVIATKFGVGWRARNGGRAETFRDATPERVVEALEASLRRLRTDCVPLYYIHWPDPKTPIHETLGALHRCREAGKLRYIAVSNFSADQVAEAHALMPLAAVQVAYNMIDQEAAQSLLPACQRLGIAAIAYGPLAQGLLTGKYQASTRFPASDRRHRLPNFQEPALRHNLAIARRVQSFAVAHKHSAAQVALRWVLDHPAVAVAIAGAKSPMQVEENAGAAGWSLSRGDRSRLSTGNNRTPQQTISI